MDKEVESGIVKSLSKIIDNNHVYFGSKPVHWCIESSSALAEAEVEYKDIVSKAVCVKFRITSSNKLTFTKNIDQKDVNLKLKLIGIDLMKIDKQYEINLLFSDNRFITLYSEIIEVTLEDLKKEIK